MAKSMTAYFSTSSTITNGLVMATIFKGQILMETKKSIGYKIKGSRDGSILWFYKEWWNAPYKEEENGHSN